MYIIGAGPGDLPAESDPAQMANLLVDCWEGAALHSRMIRSAAPLEAMHELRAFMFERVYASETAAGQKHVAVDVIRRLVDHHLAHPELMDRMGVRRERLRGAVAIMLERTSRVSASRRASGST